MKGKYEGRPPGAEEGGEVVLLKATVIKTHDASNHVVKCAGETFTPSAQGMSDAEPTAAELFAAATKMQAWEKAEAKRQAAEEEKQREEQEDREQAAAEANERITIPVKGFTEQLKDAIITALKG
ncbi:MAG: hypothetical protein EPO00_02735 [Chloroflexota bacterium]|nr:MAG: hypothetical protein EPO00_02735 [Chloroflexota bacterium]